MQDYTTISELLELAKQSGGLPQAVLEHYIAEGANKKEAVRRMREGLSDSAIAISRRCASLLEGGGVTLPCNRRGERTIFTHSPPAK